MPSLSNLVDADGQHVSPPNDSDRSLLADASTCAGHSCGCHAEAGDNHSHDCHAEHGHDHCHGHSCCCHADNGFCHGHCHCHGFASESGGHAWRIAVAAVLLVAVLALEGWLVARGWQWAEYALVAVAYVVSGWQVWKGALDAVRNGAFFDENTLMVIATVGALAIGAFPEAIGVMLFFEVGEALQDLAVSRSRRSVEAVLAVRPERARLIRDGAVHEVAPSQVEVGDSVLVDPGDRVALDGTVLEGESTLDASALTGESLPVSAGPGCQVLAGSVNLDAALVVRVDRPFAASSIARILELVEGATERKAATERFITSFARYYTPGVVLVALLVAIGPPLLAGASWSTWLYRALVLLMISCPCALVVSVPLGYFGGIGRASREGILIKGATFIDVLAQLKTIVFDKTGTLTRGVFRVCEVVSANGLAQNELLQYAAAAEMHSNHPIGRSIVRAVEERELSVNVADISGHTVLHGEGVQADYQGKRIMVGRDILLHHRGISHDRCSYDGTEMHVVVDEGYGGAIIIDDELRSDASQALAELRKLGVERLVMLTGDNEAAAQRVAQGLGLDSYYAALLPEDKVAKFEELVSARGPHDKVAFVGDGINDAPVLARADVGIAMGALGADAAIESADVVLMADSPCKVAQAIAIARHTRGIVRQNIALALGVKGLVLVLGICGMANMWAAVFADVGTALLALLNSTRTLRQ